jgi:CheY-like chemotaxis protein
LAPKPRALVIDDDSMVLRALDRNLERDCTTTLCSSAEDGLARLRAGEVFEIIFCDVAMPRMKGSDFYELVIALDPGLGTRIVLVTGGAPAAEMQRIADLGARCVYKPLRADLIAELIAEARARVPPIPQS